METASSTIKLLLQNVCFRKTIRGYFETEFYGKCF